MGLNPVRFNPWEYTPPGEKDALRYLTVGVTTACNFRCTFCSKARLAPSRLDTGFLRLVLQEAVELGLEKVEFTGGEPLMYPGLLDLADELKEKGVTTLMVSNGSNLCQNTARRLARAGVLVAVSLSTLSPSRFDRMTGTRGQLPRVMEAIRYLREAGYGCEEGPLMAVQSVASRETTDEIPVLQAWAEAQGCLFILNRPIPVGAMDRDSLISPGKLKELLGAKARVPFSLDSPCNRLSVGCYIGSDAVVKPCPCIDLHAGSLEEESLTSIWRHSPILAASRNVRAHLWGSCGRCEERARCYGCRAVAYAVFGDITAPDPGCFHYSETEEETE